MNLTKSKKVSLAVSLLGAIILIMVDQYTKYLATLHLKDQQPISIIEGVFELRYLENRGAAFGMLQDQRIFFLISTTIILSGIIYILFKLPEDKKYRWLHILLVFISAGAVGNLIDRVTLIYVVDFFYFSLIDFPIFNMADIYVSVSCVVLGILYMFYYKEEDFGFISFKKKKGEE